MKYLLFYLLTVVFVNSCFCQKIDGTYFGEVITSKNIIIIKKNKSGVTGTIYLDVSTKIDFLGTYENHLLKFSIHYPGLIEMNIEGNLDKNLLKLTVDSSHIKKLKIVCKIDSKTNVEIQDMFSDKNDVRILGRWSLIKNIDRYGEIWQTSESKNIPQYNFQAKGISYVQFVNVSLEYSFPKIDLTWSTQKDKLTIRLNASGEIFINSYLINTDTLIMKDPSGAVGYYKRK